MTLNSDTVHWIKYQSAVWLRELGLHCRSGSTGLITLLYGAWLQLNMVIKTTSYLTRICFCLKPPLTITVAYFTEHGKQKISKEITWVIGVTRIYLQSPKDLKVELFLTSLRSPLIGSFKQDVSRAETPISDHFLCHRNSDVAKMKEKAYYVSILSTFRVL